MPTHSTRTLIDDLIDIKEQLDADAGKPYESLQVRDRPIGIELSHLKQLPVKQIQGWLKKVNKSPIEDASATISRSKFAISTVLIIAGLVMGLSTAFALFYYTGKQPINIISVLAIGVGLQLILLSIFILALISRSTWLNNLLATFNAGRWAARLAYLIPSLKISIDKLMDMQAGIDEKIVKWQTVLWSQQFALAFQLALIIGCLYLVTFWDLAFGWSTTLSFENSLVKSITDTLALPWANIYPSAVPSQELIDSTRFYRLKTITLGDQHDDLINQAQMAGNWWRFLLLCLLVYGLLPRLVTFVLAKFKLTKTLNQSILALPGLHLLLDRMNNPNIATNAETPEKELDLNQAHASGQITPLNQRQTYIIHWGQPAVPAEQLSEWLVQSFEVKVLEFNILASDNTENQFDLNNLPNIKQRQALTILVKAWEPPTLELTDWLSQMHDHYQNKFLISLIPYDLSQDSKIIPAGAIDSRTWQDFLRRHNAQHIEFHGAHR